MNLINIQESAFIKLIDFNFKKCYHDNGGRKMYKLNNYSNICGKSYYKLIAEILKVIAKVLEYFGI